jgi:5,5'-dehydrodivanillate O-demethylase
MRAAENLSVTYRDFLRAGPGTLAGRYLRSYWQPVYLSKDIAVGQAKPLRIMGEDFTLFRGASGKAQVIADRCAHRGAKLSIGWVEGDEIRCAYHGWSYDAAGQCTAQPAEPKPFCDKVQIRSYPTREYLGLIIAYFGEGEPPPPPRWPEYEDAEYVHEVTVQHWPCNYFAQLENACDQVHTVVLHWQFRFGMPNAYKAEETEYGLKVQTPGLGSAGLDTSYFIMPNAHEWYAPSRPGRSVSYMGLGWRVPRDDDSHSRFNVAVFPVKGAQAGIVRAELEVQAAQDMSHRIPEYVDEILAGKRSFTDVKEDRSIFGTDLTDVQDLSIMASLNPMASREPTEMLGQSDMGIALLRRVWQRELQAFADGRPLTPWKRPDRMWEEQVKGKN